MRNAFLDSLGLSEAVRAGHLRVLVVEPERTPYVKEIPHTLEALQQEVGGLIEVIYPYADLVGLVCNEEGKLLGLPLNRGLFDKNGKMYDIVCGTFLVTGLGAEDLTSLPPDLLEKYYRHFQAIEYFF